MAIALIMIIIFMIFLMRRFFLFFILFLFNILFRNNLSLFIRIFLVQFLFIFPDIFQLFIIYLYQLILVDIRGIIIVAKKPPQIYLSKMISLREVLPTSDLNCQILFFSLHIKNSCIQIRTKCMKVFITRLFSTFKF